MIVYLVDLANTQYGINPSTVPLAIGYIKAYAMLKNPDVDIKLFRTFESLHQTIQIKQPNIIGFSWYGWNRYLTINALNYIKKHFPTITTIIGGACVSDELNNSIADAVVFGEGEIVFSEFLKTRHLKSFWKEIIENDLNHFPSPYLTGCLDAFLKDGLIPIIQISRGCPYQCTFCVSGKHDKKIRYFNFERFQKEIDYLESHAVNRSIRFNVENMGLLKTDVRIAEYIKKKLDTGYPTSISLYTDRNVNENVEKIVSILKDHIPLNVSLQTLTHTVLKNIKRYNPHNNAIRSMVNWAHKNNINVTTELIFGLPEETYKTFMAVIDQLVNLRFDSVAFGTLMMIKETEIFSSESIKKHGYEIMYSIAENGYTRYKDFENVEIDSWIVKSNYFSFQDFIKISLFNLIHNLLIGLGFFKETVFVLDSRNIKISSVINEIIDNPDKYLFFAKQLSKLEKSIKENLFNTSKETQNSFLQKYSENIPVSNQYILSFILIGELIHPKNIDNTINELFNASQTLFKEYNVDNDFEFLEELKFVNSLVKKVIIPFWNPPLESVMVSSQYDLKHWREHDYYTPLSRFKLQDPVYYRFKIAFPEQYNKFYRDHLKESYSLQSENYFRMFRTINIRRYLER